MALKVVLDTNVLISGVIAAQGPSARILEAVQRGELHLITSAALLQEFSEVIVRPHIRDKYPQVAEHAEALLDFLRVNASIVAGVPGEPVVTADPDDDMVLACALEGDANYIVSGDPHLFSLAQHNGIPILRPRQFVTTVLDLTLDTP